MDWHLVWTLLGTMALSLLLLYLVSPAADFLHLIDSPDHRKHHQGDIPLTGGISVFVTLAIVFSLTGTGVEGINTPENFWIVVLVALALVVATHAIDDAIALPAFVRFLIDALLGLFLCLFAGIKLTYLGDLFSLGIILLGSYAIVMTLFCFVAASNAFNMTDGIDSLCSGLGLICFATLALLMSIDGSPGSGAFVDVLFVVMAALIPMYMANLGMFGARMRIFLGDSGARLLGFIAAITLIMAAERGLIRPVMAYFPIAVPVCDCLVLMGHRVLQGRSPVSADRMHLHHLLLDLGYKGSQVRIHIFLLALAFSGCGIYFQVSQPEEWIVSCFVVISFACYILTRFWLIRTINRNKTDVAAGAKTSEV